MHNFVKKIRFSFGNLNILQKDCCSGNCDFNDVAGRIAVLPLKLFQYQIAFSGIQALFYPQDPGMVFAVCLPDKLFQLSASVIAVNHPDPVDAALCLSDLAVNIDAGLI